MKLFVLLAIRLWRSIKFLFPVRCRFYPSCSHYAEEAVEKYPLPKALWLAAKRIFRCNVFSRGGIDPLP